MLPSRYCLKGIIFFFFLFSFFSPSVRTAFRGYRLPSSCKKHTGTGTSSSKRARCCSVQLDPVPSLYWRVFIILYIPRGDWTKAELRPNVHSTSAVTGAVLRCKWCLNGVVILYRGCGLQMQPVWSLAVQSAGVTGVVFRCNWCGLRVPDVEAIARSMREKRVSTCMCAGESVRILDEK